MSVALHTDRTVISRLRVRGGAGDPMLTRLRASTVLSSAALAPAGISPAAILVVRSLKDPLPRKLALNGGAMRLSSEWEQAVRSEMAALTRRALRPIRDAVYETAEAVLFADHGELLACLARDWLHGAVRRWWWQALFPDRDLAAAVARAWLERADCVPAAMGHLASSGDELAFLLRLEHEVRRTMLRSVLHVHGLPELHSALAPVLQSGKHAADRTALFDADPRDRTDLRGSQERAEAPWSRHMASGARAARDGVVEAFVGVCHALREAPHLVRSRDFAEQARKWSAVQAGIPSEASAEAIRTPEKPATAPPRQTADISGDEEDHGPQRERARPGSRVTQSAVSDSPARSFEVPIVGRESHATKVAAASKHDETDEGLRIETQFGGVFLLVNLGLFLELYGDFANPGRPGIHLPVWDFIALVGEDLVGPRLRKDPVWALLARLAGRDAGEEPGCGFRPGGSWRVPGAWASWAAARALASLARQTTPRGWLRRLLRLLRFRLRIALGARTDRDVSATLLRRAARVGVTPTRLDVSFALAELPLEVRLSGLDRDPGWVPAAGRAVYFHFD